MANIRDAALALADIHRSLLVRDDEGVFRNVVQQQDEAPPQGDPQFDQLRVQAKSIIDVLDKALIESDWKPAAPLNEQPLGKGWVYGFVYRREPLRAVTRGFLEPVRRIPLVSHLPDRVILYLLTVLPDGDGLERDHHGGVGWHYHYIDGKFRRSNVILSFDTRWTAATTASTVPFSPGRPLFVEPHGEGRARFKARPHTWSDKKRAIMYEACAHDLHRGIEQFRCAKTGADPVWPRTAILTPHPHFSKK